MITIAPTYQTITNTIFKKISNYTQSFLMLLLFVGGFQQMSKAQTCNGMTTPGFRSCAGEVIVYTSNIDEAGLQVTWKISPNTSGAFFTSNGLTTIQATTVAGNNLMSVNVGPNAGAFTITLTFNDATPTPDIGSCSASRVVNKITASSSKTDILCFGDATGTMTALGSGGVLPYSYTISGPTVNTTGATTGAFTALTAGIYTITVRDNTSNGGSPEGCTATTSQTIIQQPYNPVILNCPNDTTVSCLTQAELTTTFNNWLNSFSYTGGTNPVKTFTPITPAAPQLCGGSTQVTMKVTSDCAPFESTCTKTFTLKNATVPIIANCPAGGNLGCNPTPPTCSQNVTASNECGAVQVTCTPGTILTDGCKRTQVFTYSATSCGLSATPCVVTYTWTVSTAPVIANCPAGGDLGCNPTPPTCSQNVTASNECGAVQVTCTPGTILTDGCKHTQVFTYSATSCGLSATPCVVTYTWTVSTAPVIANCPAGGDLGCNPTPPTCSQNVTASNECGAVQVTCTPGNIISNGCGRSLTFTYSATSCGLSATPCVVTYTWTVSTIPVIANCPAGGDMGCNPHTLPTCSSTVTASNQCGPVQVTCTPGTILTDGCKRTQIFTYSATSCGLSATPCVVTYTWTVSTIPVIANCPAGGDLGCNPTPPTCSSTVTASNQCGPVQVTCTPGNIISNGCGRSQKFTYSATSCGLSATPCVVTYTWTISSKPVIAGCPDGGDLGCNPRSLPTCNPNVTASSQCGSVPVICTPGNIVIDGCRRTQVFTYSAVSCGFTATPRIVTYTWKVDTEKPVFTNCLPNIDLGCNPTLYTGTTCTNSSCNNGHHNCNYNPTPDVIKATDNCSTPTVTTSVGPIISNGCSRSRTTTYTATDACGNTATCKQVVTWTVVTKPVISGCPNDTYLGCNPSTLPTCGETPTFARMAGNNNGINNITASNECGSVPVICTSGNIINNGCKRSQTFTYTATACNLSASRTVTYTWKVDTEKPTFINCPSDKYLGCNPTSYTGTTCTNPGCNNGHHNCNYNPTPDVAKATDNCSTPAITTTVGPIISNGCNRSRTTTYTATDDCGNTATCKQVVSWTIGSKPVITAFPNGGDLGCNPSSLPGCNINSVQASTDCGSAEITCTPGQVIADGCKRSQSFTYTATACGGLTATRVVNYTWSISAPIQLTCPQNKIIIGGQSQQTVNQLFADWLHSATATGGCSAGVQVTNSCGNTNAPNACGGAITVTFKASGGCSADKTCTATFTVSACASLSIGDLVWLDKNSNGIQDNGEPGISGVTVKLYSSVDGSAGSLLKTTTTNSNGIYAFNGLSAGTYCVKFITPNDHSPVAANKGGNDSKDSDPVNGSVCNVVLTTQSNITIDAGFTNASCSNNNNARMVGTATTNTDDKVATDPVTTIDFDVSPNPTYGNTSIHLSFVPTKTGRSTILLYDLNGRVVTNLYTGSSIEKKKYQVTANLKSIPEGTYLVHFINGNKTMIKKLIIAR